MVSARVGRHADFGAAYSYQRLGTERGDEIFSAHIAEIRAVYNFNTRFFVRAIVQWRRTDRNPETWTGPVDRTTRSVDNEFLVSYKVNPQTAVFLGYDDGYLASTDVDRRNTGLTLTDRRIFMKVGYAWRP